MGVVLKDSRLWEEELYLVESERIITRLLAQLKFWIKKKNW